jgi:hypothetical protein
MVRKASGLRAERSQTAEVVDVENEEKKTSVQAGHFCIHFLKSRVGPDSDSILDKKPPGRQIFGATVRPLFLFISRVNPF